MKTKKILPLNLNYNSDDKIKLYKKERLNSLQKRYIVKKYTPKLLTSSYYKNKNEDLRIKDENQVQKNKKNSGFLSFNLKTWNWIGAATHGIAAFGLGIYFLVKKGGINFNTDLYDIKINLNQDDPENSILITKKSLPISNFLLKSVVIIYFIFTTLFHILYATDCFGTGAYTRSIRSGNNYFRWVEYAISSTLMTFLIAVVCGVKSLDAIILLIYMNIAMIACGQIIEYSKSFKVKLTALGIGWILLAGIVSIFFKNFFSALQDGKNNGFKIPNWVYFIIFPLIIWYSSFGFVNIWQAFFPGKRNYEFFEKVYIILSLISKFNLGFVLGFGLTRPKAKKS